MTNVLHLPLESLKVRLLAGSPLAFLSEVLPDGVPVSPYQLSINGVDCYEFQPDVLPDEQALLRLGATITAENYPEVLVYGFFRYGTVLIPVEWIEFVS